MADTPDPGEAVQPQRTFPVSWEELHRHAKALAWRLMALGPWTGIVAITRGGLVPAAIVARELGLPAVVSIPGLTGWLRDGDLVEMDGATGTVRRLDQDGDAS